MRFMRVILSMKDLTCQALRPGFSQPWLQHVRIEADRFPSPLYLLAMRRTH